MFKKITTFIKYNNAFIIIIAILFIASFSALAASEDLREEILGEKIVTKSGIDNSLLLLADLENFDLEMKILDIMEDEESYYLDYQFKTLGIQENLWQTVLRQERLEISKKALANQDLGLYVTEELGEVIDYELAYLKEVQENENKKGDTKIVQETKYDGLLGMVISTKTKELSPEYELVVKPSTVEEQDDFAQESGSNEDSDEIYIPIEENPIIDHPEDSVYYQKLKELCEKNNLFWYDNTCNDEEKTALSDLSCDSDNLNLCDTKELCEGIDLYWYDDACNIEDKTVSALPSEEGDNPENVSVCDLNNLNLCDTEDLCEGINLYWHNKTCNTEPEAEVESEPANDKSQDDIGKEPITDEPEAEE